MKVDKIELCSSGVKFLDLTLRVPTLEDPYLITRTFGLDIDEIVRKYYGAGKITKNKFYELVARNKEISFRIKLNPDFSNNSDPSTLRDELYKAISSSREGLIEIRFVRPEGGDVVTLGTITKFESIYLAESPEVQITIKTEFGFLYSADVVDVDVSTLNKTNPSITPEESLAPHGFEFGVTFTDVVEVFSIQDDPVGDWSFSVAPGDIEGTSHFIPGDQLHISSRHGAKHIYMVRDGETINLADKVEINSVWPVMFPQVSNDFEVNNSDFNWSYIRYYNTFWGV